MCQFYLTHIHNLVIVTGYVMFGKIFVVSFNFPLISAITAVSLVNNHNILLYLLALSELVKSLPIYDL